MNLFKSAKHPKALSKPQKSQRRLLPSSKKDVCCVSWQAIVRLMRQHGLEDTEQLAAISGVPKHLIDRMLNPSYFKRYSIKSVNCIAAAFGVDPSVLIEYDPDTAWMAEPPKTSVVENLPPLREFDCAQCGKHVVVTRYSDKRKRFCSPVCSNRFTARQGYIRKRCNAAVDTNINTSEVIIS